MAQAQTPANRLHFAFSDAPGSVTTVSDTNLNSGAVTTSLTMLGTNGTTAVDLHGAVGSGVNGAVTGNRAMDFTSDLTSSQGNTQPANNTANAVSAQDWGDTNLLALGNGGVITNFVATIWIKQVAQQPANIGPRLWILNAGATGVDSGGSSGCLGLKFQMANQLYLQIDGDVETLGPANASNFPTNQWLFFAVTYDGTTASMFYGTDSSATALLGSATTSSRVINLNANGATNASLTIGNRNTLDRGFNGWINDFRFYNGSPSSSTALAFVENIRRSGVPTPVTISSGLTANNKTYNGTTAATLSSNNVVLSGVIGADTNNVSLSTNGYTATFASAAVGNGKTVTVSGLTLTGSAAGNYTLTQPTLSANITAATVTISSGLTANNKIYNGTTAATLSSNNVVLAGVVAADTNNVRLSTNGYTATFASAGVGNGVSVNVSGLTLTGSAAGNYTLTQPTLSANITAATVTISSGLTANNKTYNGTTAATLSSNNVVLSGVIGADTNNVRLSTNGYTATFASKAVGNGKTVTVSGLTLTGSAAGNYTLTQPTLSANITAAPVTISSGLTANNKTYNGTTAATLSSNNVVLAGVVAADTNNVKLSTNGYTATFASAGVGNGVSVSVSGLTLTGSAAGNYTLTQPTLSANITAATVTISSGLTANNKTYNGTTAATLSSNNVVLAGVVAADTNNVRLSTNGYTATFASAVVGNGKTVTVSGLTLTGSAAGNYTLTQPTLSANITAASTLNAVASSLNPALPGSNVTFTATLSVVSPGGGTPTGTVNFRIDGSIIGSGTLSGSMATFTTNNLTHGSHTVVAEYAGDGNFFGSTNSLSPNQVINTPPVAGNATVYRNPVLSVKVLLSTLLTNANDADGDTLNLTVGSTSASNATITVSGGWVFYTPPAGFTNADSFTYTVTDGYGGSATGTVTVAIQVDLNQSQNIVAIQNLGNSTSQVWFAGIPTRAYSIQSTTNLVAPAWLWLGAGTADTVGRFQFIDTNAVPLRFYRSTYP